MDFDPKCMAIAIGSVPHTDSEYAIDMIMKYLPEAPIWPQLPKRGVVEGMTGQYSEGMPCVRVDRDNNKVYFDTSDDNYLDEVSEKLGLALADDFEAFKISADFAKGFYALKERLSKDFPDTIKILKGHVTGPISFGLSMHDETGRSILYNDNMRDAVINILAMKAKWQVREFKKISSAATPMIFFDEPSLTQIGTPFVSIQKDEAVEILNTCLDAVDGVKGIHVCGNTDWALISETNTDIINFDAYGFPQSLSLYPHEISGFLERGGMIAWGITPSTDDIISETKESLLKRLEDAIDLLCDAGFDKAHILKRSFVSPSCGTGSLSEELAGKVFRLNFEVSNLIREKYL